MRRYETLGEKDKVKKAGAVFSFNKKKSTK